MELNRNQWYENLCRQFECQPVYFYDCPVVWDVIMVAVAKAMKEN